MTFKPSRIIPWIAAALLLASGVLWAWSPAGISGRVIAGLWIAALAVAVAPLVASLIDRGKGRGG